MAEKQSTSKQVTLSRDPQIAAAIKETVEAPLQVAALPSTKKIIPSHTGGATKLSFNGSETSLNSAGKARLDAIAAQLQSSESQRLAIRAYASADKGQEVLARRIALARGLAVRAYLIEQGVGALRINVQSVGNKQGNNTPNEVVLELKNTGGA